MDKTLGIGDAGSALLGAGLANLSGNIKVALVLVGVGVVLKVLVAVLQKQGLVVSAPSQG